ncbi:hypothetical protein [Photobacterium leiognathi]|uniref:hypothetical protein n=1 Tax=Photobacterium leiognathi TaxID=553611 RepID=UPI002981570E|nr:hypothetical protein [Photobacterium leiognathi]
METSTEILYSKLKKGNHSQSIIEGIEKFPKYLIHSNTHDMILNMDMFDFEPVNEHYIIQGSINEINFVHIQLSKDTKRISNDIFLSKNIMQNDTGLLMISYKNMWSNKFVFSEHEKKSNTLIDSDFIHKKSDIVNILEMIDAAKNHIQSGGKYHLITGKTLNTKNSFFTHIHRIINI